MVKVSIEVRKWAARFEVAVRARSMGWVLSLVEGWYPRGNYRVKVLTDHPHSLFAEDLVAQARIVGFGQLARVTA